MAEFKIEISDSDVGRVLTSLASNYNRPIMVPNPDFDDSQPVSVDDVVALYLVAERGSELKGEHILSATYAAQLEYGEMNIFHHRLHQLEKFQTAGTRERRQAQRLAP